jgi:formylglycine-generating enzyme required for sulfatase activity
MLDCIQIRLIAWVSVVLLAYGIAEANNIQVSGATIAGRNTEEEYALVQFDISWENSWRTASAPNNWDAAWVFLKCRRQGGDWQHALLNDTGHSAPAGSALEIGLLEPASAFHPTSNPGLGILLFRNMEGSGTFSAEGIEVRWNFGANGIGSEDAVDIVVFAVEMVFVPAGSFYVGSGGTESGSFTDGSWTSGSTIPLQIVNENELVVSPTAGNLWSTAFAAYQEGSLPASFPKGSSAFYCMKYEITQKQYVDFLNSLSRAKQTYRFTSTTVGEYMTNPHDPTLNPPTIPSTVPKCRNGIRLMSDPGSPNPRVYGNDLDNDGTAGGSLDGQNIACNFLSWVDAAAILDWMGLRPMTELEYEKACRGPASAIANEYAWGNTTTNQAKTIRGDVGGSTEVIIVTDNANAAYGNHAGVPGPLRTGIFATNLTNRASSGASYYGIMEMSGNLREWTISVTLSPEPDKLGRMYTGKHGNGELDAFGYPDVSTWPNYGTHSIGLRGGDWANTLTYMQTSDRVTAFMPNSNQLVYGGRGVRTAP